MLSAGSDIASTFCSKMNARGSIVDHYLSEFRSGRCDDAFHSLIETDSAIIQGLINAYEDAKEIDAKVFLIEVVSEFRLDSSLCFLRHALRRDDEPQIWKAALNGMAMAESPEAVDAMDHALSSVQDSTKRDWIQEAITDTKAAITKKQNNRGCLAAERSGASKDTPD
ncbi:MAG: hypothetical protein KDK99_22505 [Verrucomicrobiales bacterium]|nr:hypothetical protein [Verrucomicrobiales bacterium]